MNHDAANPNDPGTTEAVSQSASVWMKRGLALLNAGTPASLTEAIRCFDQAIELRHTLPLEKNPKFRYGLAAGWLNRGDALTRLGGATHLTEALRSFDEALKWLNTLPLDADPLFRRRLAIAWQNRGLVLQNQNDATALIAAEKSFANAIAVLQNERAVEILDRDPILAAIWMNRANALIFQKSAEAAVAAREAAKQTLILVAPIEMDDLGAAEAGFKARYILCQAIAQLLAEKNGADALAQDWLAETTDAVDESMKSARAWERGWMRA